MHFKALLLSCALSLTLAACSDAKEDEAKRLGFSSFSEMESVQAKGWHTNAQYVADETERAKRFGFASVDELHDAEAEGIMNPAAYRKHKAQEEAREAREAREAEGSAGDEAAAAPAQAAPAAPSSASRAPKQVAASSSSCMKLASSTQQFADEVGTSIGVNPSRIEIVGGEYAGYGDICSVTIQTPLGAMKCNSGPIYTDDGGATTYTAAPGLGVNNSCEKTK